MLSRVKCTSETRKPKGLVLESSTLALMEQINGARASNATDFVFRLFGQHLESVEIPERYVMNVKNVASSKCYDVIIENPAEAGLYPEATEWFNSLSPVDKLAVLVSES